jgi:IS5 family transposase
MGHSLAKLAPSVDWGFLETRFGAAYMDNLVPSNCDEAMCKRWDETPYFQLSCGEAFFRHKQRFDRSSVTRGW